MNQQRPPAPEAGRQGRSLSLRDLAEATPDSRERYVDLLRAFSICVVVLGHWLIASIYWKHGRITGENALDVIPGLWLATWVLQVMPIFFFVGGFSNLVTLNSIESKGGGFAEFLQGRLIRLLRPTAVLLLVWLPVAVAADIFSPLNDKVMSSGTTLLTRPLWFIGIYLIVILFAPAMAKVHKRYGVTVVAVMIAGAIAVDFASKTSSLTSLGYLNFAFVWLLSHQLGFFYADGSLARLKKSHFGLMAAGGLLALVALTTLGPYSPSMVGLVNERSNTNPPTVAIVALTIWQVALVMLLRDRANKWLAKVRPWMVVIFVNSVIMTLFLWHQTAIIAAVGFLYPLGFPQPPTGSGTWWLVRPLWVGVLAILLSILVLIFGRFERVRRAAPEVVSGKPLPWAAAVGGVLVIAGILGFAVSGLDGFARSPGDELIFLTVNPLQNAVHCALGAFIVRAAASGRRRTVGVAGTFLGVIAVVNLIEQRLSEALVLNLAWTGIYLIAAVLLGVSASLKVETPKSTPPP